MNLIKDVEGVVEKGVVETRLGMAKVMSAWAITPSKIVKITILKPHTLHIIGRNCTKFQVNPMKDVGGVAERDLLARWPDGITHTRMDEGHFYSPPQPT